MREVDPAIGPPQVSQVQEASTATASGGFSPMRWIAGASSTLAVLGFSAEQAQSSVASVSADVSANTASATPPYCDPNHFYPGLCDRPKQAATNDCAVQASNNNNPFSSHLKATYNKAAHKFKFSFQENDMGGCHYAGDRIVSYAEESQTPTGTFAKVGKTTFVKANGALKVNKSVAENCASPTVAGSVVRETVTVKYLPKKGWGKVPKTAFGTPLVWSHSTKPQKVC